MEYLNPTDARILLRKRLFHFLSGTDRLFVVIGPAQSGRKTIIERVLHELSLTDRTEHCVTGSPLNFYEYLNRFPDADVLLIEESSITAAEGKRREWYMDALDRIHRNLAVMHPSGPQKDDFPPSSLRVQQKVILLVEAQHHYHPAWKKFSGLAFDESVADLCNYVQWERSSILKTHGVSEVAFSRAISELKTLCQSQPEYYIKPKPDSPADLSQLIGAMRSLDTGADDWNKVFDSWSGRAEQDVRAKKPGVHFDLSAFLTLDGVRGKLLLPRMIEAFMKSDSTLFSFVLRYPVHLQHWHISALEQYVSSEKIVHIWHSGGKEATSFYEALVTAQDGGVVVADNFIEGSDRSKDEKSVITMIQQVAAGNPVTRPGSAQSGLPESIEFSGKLVLFDEGIPKSGRMRHLVENNPGIEIQDSFSDTVHRLLWWNDSGDIEQSDWYRFLDTLFQFVVRFSDNTTARKNTGPSEQSLVEAWKKIIATSGNELHKVDDFTLQERLKRLRDEEERPDRTVASFADRAGPLK